MRTAHWLALSCAVAAGTLLLASCTGSTKPPIKPVAHVDVKRFMGPWYVIASIPSYLEKDAYNAVESYALLPDGRIQTTFRYRNNAFDAPLKTMRPVGTVQPGTEGAVWGMQFIWPIKAQYVIAYVSDSYSETIVARDKRDYVWIMARTPTIPPADYDAMVTQVQQMGYDTSKLRRVPQHWPEAAAN